MSTHAFKRFQFWAAIALVVAFFLPWVSVVSIFGLVSLNGYQFADAVRQNATQTLAQEERSAPSGSRSYNSGDLQASERMAAASEKKVYDAKAMRAWSYLVYLIPIAAIACIVTDLRNGGPRPRRRSYILTALIALLVLAIFYWQGNDDGKLLGQLSIGTWLTAGAAVALLVGAFVPASSAQPATQGVAVQPV